MFERIVEEGEDAFELTDGVLYFTEVDYDMKWLITQVNRIMDIDNDVSCYFFSNFNLNHI